MGKRRKQTIFTIEEFEKIKERAELYYALLESVYCPYLKEKINFNQKGISHIKFKRWNNTRPLKDQYMRLKLIHLAPEVLKNSYSLQGIWQTHEFERQKKYGKWEAPLKRIVFYEFIAVIERNRVKVIVKQIEGGESFFWSIIPFWRMDKFRNRILHEGNPDID